MKRYHLIFLFFMTISIVSLLGTAYIHANDKTKEKQNILTQEQAAILASKIANEKFQKDFGISPFTPESYAAELVDDKWRWGKISPAGINGCSAVVTFDKYGSSENVKIAFHSDQLRKIEIQKKKTQIDRVIIVIPDIDDHKDR
ncbi:hypothetical protein ACFL6W_02060 [Thermodesulfobacteriota bacterium]